jgi:hypothetical protein
VIITPVEAENHYKNASGDDHHYKNIGHPSQEPGVERTTLKTGDWPYNQRASSREPNCAQHERGMLSQKNLGGKRAFMALIATQSPIKNAQRRS